MTLLDDDQNQSYSRADLAVFDLLQHPVWVFDITEKCMYWANLKALEIWNAKSREELLNRNFKSDMSQATERRMQDHLGKLKKGEVMKEQWTYYPNGGEAKTLGVTGSGIRIEGGRVAALAEAELPDGNEIEQSSVRGVEILRHLPLPVCEFDVQGSKLIYQNPQAFALFASPDGGEDDENDDETTTTATTAAATDDGDATITEATDATSSASHKTDEATTVVVTENGDATITDATSSANHDTDEASAAAASGDGDATITDATASANHDTDEFSVTEANDDGDAAITEATASANHDTDEASAAPAKDTSNQKENISDFISRFVDRALGTAILNKLAKEGAEVYNAETELYTKQGPRWFSTSVRRSKDPVTSDPILLWSAQDITEIIQARKDRQVAATKTEFFAIMAHEIRTPLHQIMGHMDLLELTELGAAQLETVKVVQSSTASLMAIMDDLLDYTKLENGRLQLQHVEFQPQGIVQGCIAAVRKDVEEKYLTIVEDFCNFGNTKLMGDPNRLRQIILNFLTNAIKFTHEGSITLKVRRVSSSTAAEAAKMDSSTTISRNPTDLSSAKQQAQARVSGKQQARQTLAKERLRFEIIDTGIGIHPTHQTQLFGKHQQGNAAIARNFGGTGLGLAICKGMTEAMGGTVGLSSELDKGTTVFCEIPFDLVDMAAPFQKRLSNKRRLSVQSPLEEEKLRILVVEDNAINQKMVNAMLKRMGHTSVLADNGQIAVDHVRNNNTFDVVLMDVQMPVMDGIEATKQIRLLDSQLPIIGLTASYIASDLEYYQSIGMSTCLGKPARLGVLKKTIESVYKESMGYMEEDMVVQVRTRFKGDKIMEEKKVC